MNKQEKIQNEIDKTLDLFDEKKLLTPNPYFFTRVQQGINEKSKKESKILGILKPALLTCLFLINVGTFIWHSGSNETYIQVDSKQQLIEFISADLNLEQEQIDLFNLE